MEYFDLAMKTILVGRNVTQLYSSLKTSPINILKTQSYIEKLKK